MNIEKILLIALFSAICAVFIKRHDAAGALMTAAAACVTLMISAVPYVKTVFERLLSLTDSTGLDRVYFTPVAKAVGTALSVKICSDICRDAGQTAIATAVEMAGTFAGTVFILPLLDSALKAIKGL